jgi:hypothetical protein
MVSECLLSKIIHQRNPPVKVAKLATATTTAEVLERNPAWHIRVGRPWVAKYSDMKKTAGRLLAGAFDQALT